MIDVYDRARRIKAAGNAVHNWVECRGWEAALSELRQLQVLVRGMEQGLKREARKTSGVELR